MCLNPKRANNIVEAGAHKPYLPHSPDRVGFWNPLIRMFLRREEIV